MSVRDDIEGALSSWAAREHESDDVAREIFDGVVTTLRGRFPDVSRSDFELLLADNLRAAETVLSAVITDTVAIEDAVNVAARLLGED